jgi:glycosyltransferase involved in cell wall biosynthesis
MTPVVSVIVPNYNHAQYLSKRIDSILAQTFVDFEVIILDDRSTDNSREILEKYALQDGRVRLVFNEQNSGSTFMQWNKGVQLAKGEYVWLAESDDWADCTFLEKMLKAIGTDENVGIVYAQSYEVDEEGRIIGSRLDWTSDLKNCEKWLSDYQNPGIKEINENLCLKNTIPNVSATLIKREAYIAVGMANSKMKYAGDWDLYVKILKHFAIVYVAEHLNYNRRHEKTLRAQKTFTKLAVEEIRQILLEMSTILQEKKKNEAYRVLSQRWAKSLYDDASHYSIREMFIFYNFFSSSLAGKGKEIYLLMLRRLLPF